MNDYAKNDVMLSKVKFEPSIIFCDETSQEVGKFFLGCRWAAFHWQGR